MNARTAHAATPTRPLRPTGSNHGSQLPSMADDARLIEVVRSRARTSPTLHSMCGVSVPRLLTRTNIMADLNAGP
jgi:hypothetical protein